jgi:hypothetical protein
VQRGILTARRFFVLDAPSAFRPEPVASPEGLSRIAPLSNSTFLFLTFSFIMPSILPEKISNLVTHGTLDKIFQKRGFFEKPSFQPITMRVL